MKKQRSIKFIGKCKNCGKTFVRNSKYSEKQLKKAEFCSRSCANSGKFHPLWNGGKYETKEGYIKIKKRSHPFCDTEGYVMEHRLVMERFLNRYLKQTEVVHHINGDRSNNRLKNLILFENNIKHLQKEHNIGFKPGHPYGNRFKKGHISWNKNLK